MGIENSTFHSGSMIYAECKFTLSVLEIESLFHYQINDGPALNVESSSPYMPLTSIS